MDPVAEALERARESPTEDLHFRSALRTLCSQIEDESLNELYYNIELLDSTAAKHPLLEALRGYRCWVNNRDYEEGAKPALENYEGGIEQALDDDWFNVSTWAIAEYIELADEVNHDSRVQDVTEQAIDLLESEYTGLEAHEGNAGRVLDAITHVNIQPIDSEVLDRIIEFCWTRAEYTNKKNNHRAERKYLRRIARIKRQRDESTESVQDAIIESYEDEIEFQRTRGHLVTATTIEDAINECSDFASEERLNRWRLEKREENRSGMEEEMTQVTREVPDTVAENFEQIADGLVESFEEATSETRPEIAFLELIQQPVFLPNLEDSETEQPQQPEGDIDVDFPTATVADIFPREILLHEGDSVPEEVSNIDVPQSYSIEARLSSGLLARVLYRILNRGLIREWHFYTLLEMIDGATVDDKAFLTDFIVATFEDRHPEAIHLGMARLEGVIKHQLESSGIAVTGDIDGIDRAKTLGGLLNRLEEVLDERYVTYLKFRYHDVGGEALRNRIAHGNLRYREAHFDKSASLLVEVFRSTVRIRESTDPDQ
jgi:hypothetical protein